jgi:hypothetical protein
MYNSAAEPLPKPTAEDFEEVIRGEDSLQPSLETSSVVDTRSLLTIAAQTQLIRGVQVRYLQWQPLVHLYMIFTSVWETQRSWVPGFNVARKNVPSWSVFHTRYATIWSHCLKFRKPSEHGQCDICHKLQAIISRYKTSIAQKLDAARALKQHYKDQYVERCIYWSLRHASKMSLGVLCIIIDSMDKTKFAWPRFAGRLPKSLHGRIRPTMTLTAAIAHGFLTSIYVQSQRVDHGADNFCEILCHVLWLVSQMSSGATHLVLQVDNTTAQAKNQYAFAFLAYLVMANIFETVTINFLMVGHTHEDIDQLFGIICTILLGSGDLLLPDNFIAAIQSRLQSNIADAGMSLHTTRLTAVRSFSDWLYPQGLHAGNSFQPRDGVETIHSATFRRLTCDEAEKLGVEVGDVYVTTKGFMRDTLHSAPIIALRADRMCHIDGDVPREVVPLKPLTDRQIEEFLKIAAALEKEHHMPVADELRSLVVGRDASLLPLHWLSKKRPAKRVERLPLTANPFFEHLRPDTWELQVADHGPGAKRPKRK